MTNAAKSNVGTNPKGECIRPGTPLSLEDARRLVEGYVEHYNNVRLNSAIGYITPKDMLDSGRAGSEVGSGEGTAEESPPAGRVTDETDYFRLADHPLAISNFGKHRFHCLLYGESIL